MNSLLRALVALAGMVGGAAMYLRRRNRSIEYAAPESFIIQPAVDVALERRDDGSYEIRWVGEGTPTRLHIGTQPDAIDRENALAATWENGRGVIEGSAAAIRQYFEVVFSNDGGEERRLMLAERILPLDGAVNFRDLGGYRTADGRRVRWGRVYRSGSLANLTEADQAYLRSAGLKLVCDLRSTREIDRHPNNLPLDGGISYLHLPLDTEDSTLQRLHAIFIDRRRLEHAMEKAYTKVMIDRNADVFGAVLRHLADADNLPAVFHCTAGKDRTGVTAALVLAALGVPDDVIIADYTLSNHYYDSVYAFTQRAIRPVAFLGVRVEDLQPLLIADAEKMRFTLEYVREHYGSVADYLRSTAGVDDAMIDRLKANLLE
jgi:protein-tyrosine phosphatase